MIQRIAVFCGSASGSRPEYLQAARRLGALMGQQKRTLVFGGCQDGLMAELSRAVLSAGGRVESEFIRGLYRDSDHLPAAEEHLWDTLEERTLALIRRSEACIALPGGMGTLDELTEVFARMQLGMPRRPVGLLNVCGYYDPLARFAQAMCREGFLSPEWADLFFLSATPEALLTALDEWKAPGTSG